MSRLVPYLAIFAGIILCVIVIPGSLDTLAVAKDFDHFVPVQAEVTSIHSKKHRKGPTTGVVEYKFETPDGTQYKGDNGLTRIGDSPEFVEGLVEHHDGADRIKVYFDPHDPSRSVIHEVGVLEPLGFIAMSLLLLGGGLHASIIDRRRRRLQANADAARRR